MAEGVTSGISHGASQDAGKVTRAIIAESAVRVELDRVLSSPEFRSSRRSQEFLRYVVEGALQGRGDTLKERTIGIDVFGRPASYDPSEDATVRVKAGEVRKRLGLYYATEGRADPVRIELPGGTYVPEFSQGNPAIATEQKPVAVPRNKPFWLRRPGIILVLCLAVVLAAGLAGWLRARPPTSPIEEFWSPVLQGSSPVLLCASFVPNVYARKPDAPPERPGRSEDFVLLTDQFVGGGDLLAVSRISSMLTRMQRVFRVRIGNDVSFQDLRAAPAILVGYSYTRWKEISKELRFFIDAARWPLMVTDNGAPTKWSLPDLPLDRRTNEDYAIVTRVFHPDTEAMLVELAGITQYGTDAAADLVTNPDLLTEAVRSAPPGWQKKNLQFVLHVKVISGTPASPKVVAIHSW